MPEPSFHTVNLQDWLKRLRDGDPDAREELLRACQGRLVSLARRMLRRFPAVSRWADTDDVFQGAVVRLLRALESVDVNDTRQFLNLAGAIIRRELIDLARRFRGPLGIGANHSSHPPDSDGPRADPAAPDDDSAVLDRWTALHEAASALPAEQREVFGLRFYHQWELARIAELFQVNEKTVRRRWRDACAALNAALGGDLPDAAESA